MREKKTINFYHENTLYFFFNDVIIIIIDAYNMRFLFYFSNMAVLLLQYSVF